MRIALTRVLALVLAAGCAGNLVRERSPLPGTDIALLHHLLADIDSVRPWEGPTVPVYIEYRPYWTPHTRETIPENGRIAVTSPEVLKQRINTILAAGKDTVSVSPYRKCPAALMPDISREACPSQLMTILAFSDTFTLRAGAGLGSTDQPQLIAIVDRTYLTSSGKHMEAFYYTLEHGPAGWRTVRRYSTGVGH